MSSEMGFLVTKKKETKPIDSQSFLPKIYFLEIVEIFWLDMGQISSNLLKKAFAT